MGLGKTLEKYSLEAGKVMQKNFKVMEDNQILIQENQVEFQKYLDELVKRQILIDNKISNLSKNINELLEKLKNGK